MKGKGILAAVEQALISLSLSLSRSNDTSHTMSFSNSKP